MSEMTGKRIGHGHGKDIRILIAGAGLSGILMGIRLKRAGLHNFRIFEKAADIGGTWRDNRYPGVACDTPAHAYVYSFHPNPRYRSRYAKGPEILAYYKRMARKYGIMRHVTCSTEIAEARWTGASWQIATTAGEQMECEVFISACGRLHHPVIPDIPGLEDFAGPAFHSARWDPSVDLRDKRVGLIGTGSTAAQIVTALPALVERLVVFQRTPHWFVELPNTPLAWWKRLRQMLIPGEARRYYDKLHRFSENLARQRMKDEQDGWTGVAAMCRQALDAIRDPDLRAKLTPDYAVGCKRLIMCSGFGEAIQSPNVTLEVEAIDRIEPGGVRMRDGRFHPIDVLCLATGFHSDAFMRPMRVTGKDGLTIAEQWQDAFVNYRTVAVPMMPNFFMINGPFSPGGTSSIVQVAEVQTNYVLELVEKIAAEGGSLHPRADRTQAVFEEIRAEGRKTVWALGGCKSWYLDKNGAPIVDPKLPSELARSMAHAHFEDFVHDREPVGREPARREAA